MAQFTKAQVRSLIQAAIDDPSAQRWTAATLDLLTQTVIDSLWTDILDFAPWFNNQLDASLAPLSPGYIDLNISGVGSGQLTKRFYRIHKVIRNSQEYDYMNQRDTLVQNNFDVVQPRYDYTFYGRTQLWLFPLDASSTYPIDVWYSYLPAPYSGLADGTIVEWPDGYDDVIINATAARALIKGDAEDMAQYKALADEGFTRMKGNIPAPAFGPPVANIYDTPITWGSI
jgi:hypothetical protein